MIKISVRKKSPKIIGRGCVWSKFRPVAKANTIAQQMWCGIEGKMDLKRLETR